MVGSVDTPPGAKASRRVLPEIGYCEEKTALLQGFLASVQELIQLQHQQTSALIEGDSDFARFDTLIHMAIEKKDQAKYALMAHVDSHHCWDGKG